MKRIFFLLLIFCFHFAHGQIITARVVDSLNNKPLTYAIILFHYEQRVTYTDLNGYFSLQKDSLMKNDSITIQFLGYNKITIGVSELQDGKIFTLSPEMRSLTPVIVSNCRKTEDFLLNKKKQQIRQYIGPGPATKLVIMARYNNISGRKGFIKRISILIDEKLPNMQIPIRLRWYEWDFDNNKPGKELTDTNLVVYPYREGWNDFDIPTKSLACAKDYLVFGLEFIYTPEYEKQYDSLKTDKEKLRWLNDMQNRWSLALQYVRDENESGFYMVNNGEITRYDKKFDRYFVRPAMRFVITVCAD
jgi:hypothetical protein